MKKQFEHKGINFTMEVILSKPVKERSIDGSITHFIVVTSEDGEYKRIYKVTLWSNVLNAASSFEGALASAEYSAREWVNAKEPQWEQKLLMEMGFSPDYIDTDFTFEEKTEE